MSILRDFIICLRQQCILCMALCASLRYVVNGIYHFPYLFIIFINGIFHCIRLYVPQPFGKNGIISPY